jgi:hypothetical protein
VGEHLRKHKVTGTGYTNEDNPFGDTNLTERFVWGKKLQKEIAGGRDVREMTAKAEMARQAERLVGDAAGLCWAGAGAGGRWSRPHNGACEGPLEMHLYGWQ